MSRENPVSGSRFLYFFHKKYTLPTKNMSGITKRPRKEKSSPQYADCFQKTQKSGPTQLAVVIGETLTIEKLLTLGDILTDGVIKIFNLGGCIYFFHKKMLLPSHSKIALNNNMYYILPLRRCQALFRIFVGKFSLNSVKKVQKGIIGQKHGWIKSGWRRMERQNNI